MKRTRKRTLSVILISISMLAGNLCHAQQQRVQFTQYMFNNLIINPAYAGADEALSLTFIDRSQWSGVKNAPRTQTFSAHTLSSNKRMGLGMTLQNDRLGAQKNLSGLLVYSYHLKTGKNSVLSMGLQSGFHNTKRDYTSLTGSSNDPQVQNLYITRTMFDFGAGVYFRAKDFRAGLSSPSLLTEKISLNDSVRVTLRSTNIFGFFSYVLKVNDEVDMMPSTLIKYAPGLPLGFDVNAAFIYRKLLTMGLSYRHNESVDFLMKAKVTPLLQLGYAYDYPTGILSRLSNGSHELMVNYLFKSRRMNQHRLRR
jgi:type IX secretion system PorP/SprF family membrane protein